MPLNLCLKFPSYYQDNIPDYFLKHGKTFNHNKWPIISWLMARNVVVHDNLRFLKVNIP